MFKTPSKLTFMLCTLAVLLAGCAETATEPVETQVAAKTGKCELNPPAEPIACTMQYDPVCGCDNKTYSNACMARAAGVPSSTPGACEEKAKTDKNPNH